MIKLGWWFNAHIGNLRVHRTLFSEQSTWVGRVGNDKRGREQVCSLLTFLTMEQLPTLISLVQHPAMKRKG